MNQLKYPLICFDLDGTLVDDTIYIWKTLHETFQTNAAIRKASFDDYFANRITYQEWFEIDLKLLKEAGATQKSILQIIDGLRPMAGALELLQLLRQRGHKIALISGSLDIVVHRLFPEFQFDHLLINKLFFYEDGTIKGGEHTPFDIEGKAHGLQAICDLENLPIKRTVFIGDNENDIHIAKAAGFSIAFNCKSENLRAICDVELPKNKLDQVAQLV